MDLAENEKTEKFQKIPLELKGITKKFPGIIANDNVEFTLREGEIHTILGENGQEININEYNSRPFFLLMRGN
ncbi:MAG: hypothetical protein CM1200mP28_08360 [Deltaproteobacteria bacterium]|nr:MAG: hypothetical protein CM1200mP28_08360 [Deltaproteobacteria bacterium]